MKQQKLNGYTPKYPKKLLKGAALTAAALVAMSGAACKPVQIAGDVTVPDETDELVLDGEVAIETPEPDLPGEPTADEGEDTHSHTRDGDLMLEGKIAADDTQNP